MLSSKEILWKNVSKVRATEMIKDQNSTEKKIFPKLTYLICLNMYFISNL